jgi:hypothetical protein
MMISELKRGEYFTVKPIAEPTPDQVFIKGAFDRKLNKYDCERYNAKCRHGAKRMFTSNTKVYTEFVF